MYEGIGILPYIFAMRSRGFWVANGTGAFGRGTRGVAVEIERIVTLLAVIFMRYHWASHLVTRLLGYGTVQL